jgi:cytochrome P450
LTEISLEGYSPMDPANQQDPYPYYAALRAKASVYLSDGGLYFVSSHAAVQQVLQQPNLFSSHWGNTAGPPPVEEAQDELNAIVAEGYPPVNTMLTLDPPLQTRYRKSIGKAFSTRRIGSLEPRIREIAIDLIDALPESGRVEFREQVSVPFPVRVIADLLSIPHERDADVKRWSDDSVASIGVKISTERALEAARSVVEMQHYLASLIEPRQQSPQDDFLSELAAADFEDETGTIRKLNMSEMISMIQQLMVAGNEATAKGITEVMKLLIEHPSDWKRIQEDPSCTPSMVEEALRVASPNQGLFRICTEDAEVQGFKIPKGARLWVMFGSANRDESVFPEPNRFDPTRKNLNESFAFGRGAHFCIGAPLARLEIRVLFEELSKQLESAHFAPGAALEYEPSFILRGLKELQIDIERRGV